MSDDKKKHRVSLTQQFFKILPVKTYAETTEAIRNSLRSRRQSSEDSIPPSMDVPRVQEKIGTGNCGTVVTVCEEGEITAVKVPLNPLESYQMHGIVKTLSTQPGGEVFPKVYPNIMTTAGPGLRMEYFPGAKDIDVYLGELRAQNRHDLMLERTRQLLYEVLGGVNLLHQAGYVHGSLKPGNIIVVPANATNEDDNGDTTTTTTSTSTRNSTSSSGMMIDENTPVHAKLIDFGWTREAVAGEDSHVVIRYPGTAKFAPPETRNQGVLYRVQPQSAEIWTIAASFYFSITGELVPVDTASNQADVSRIESDTLRALLSRMLHVDPAQRVTAAEALQDFFFH